MKKIVVLLFVFLSLLAVGTARAQENPEETAKRLGITFPIVELGSCKDYAQCRSFCEDPLNQNACIAFAKAKGFYKEEGTQVRKDAILSVARSELGCSSESTCRTFCSQEANFDTCSSFAKKHNLGGGHVEDTGQVRTLEKAKQILGCNSEASCKTFCEQETNRQKCSDFAKDAGLRGGEQQVGPGGCASEETCKSFCSDPNNYQICSQYSSAGGNRFSGPGGCASEESCRSYCKSHPQECGGTARDSERNYNPEEMCNKTPHCSWTNNTCQCGSYGAGGQNQEKAEDYAKFCRENPDKCSPNQSGGFGTQQERQQFEDFCTKNPEKCGATNQSPGTTGTSSNPSYSDPAAECAKISGCSWTNNTCQCQGSQNYNPPPQEGYSQDPATGCAQAGGSWANGACQFGQPSNSPGSSNEYQTPPANEAPPFPSEQVQGAKTNRGLIQFIFQSIFGRQ